MRYLIWTHWDLNPGPSACEADVIPLHHVPLKESVHPPRHARKTVSANRDSVRKVSDEKELWISSLSVRTGFGVFGSCTCCLHRAYLGNKALQVVTALSWPGSTFKLLVTSPAIAQLVEHLTVDHCSNQMVPGSIPGGRISSLALAM